MAKPVKPVKGSKTWTNRQRNIASVQRRKAQTADFNRQSKDASRQRRVEQKNALRAGKKPISPAAERLAHATNITATISQNVATAEAEKTKRQQSRDNAAVAIAKETAAYQAAINGNQGSEGDLSDDTSEPEGTSSVGRYW